jgi:putative Mg2+ transporter-C (MgtC) family protein
VPGSAGGLHVELVVEIALAVLCGGALGLEREINRKPAGLRTLILICAGAALFTNLSQRMDAFGGDPGRIASQILPGIGFVGAGAILHFRRTIHGLTTAATIWVAAAIGMCIGFGAWMDALAVTGIVVALLVGLMPIEKWIQRRWPSPPDADDNPTGA